MNKLRIQTVAESADGVDEEGNYFRYFDYEGQINVKDVTASLGCPGLTLARNDFVYDEDHVFGAKWDDDWAGHAGSDFVPALRLCRTR